MADETIQLPPTPKPDELISRESAKAYIAQNISNVTGKTDILCSHVYLMDANVIVARINLIAHNHATMY